MGYTVVETVEQARALAGSVRDFADDQAKRAHEVGADHDAEWWEGVAGAAEDLSSELSGGREGEVR